MPEYLRPEFDKIVTIYKRQILQEIEKGKVRDPFLSKILKILLDEQMSIERKSALIQSFSKEKIRSVVEHLKGEKMLLNMLPWDEWLKDNIIEYIQAATVALTKGGKTELAPILREKLRKTGSPEIMRAFGFLKDRESIPVVVSFLKNQNPLQKVLAIETLGEIGGNEARDAILEILPSLEEKERRIALRSLAKCADKRDKELFFKLTRDKDWMVRLSSIEYFEGSSSIDAVEAICYLSSDPVQIVANRAISYLEKRKDCNG
ncbi:MAG: HEAT repeat domain-containing protein [Thermoanaerobaculaceae bacterium]|nr:HEAT repeat domain-containing protein [Thermoanaerobaculaceae bacterium]